MKTYRIRRAQTRSKTSMVKCFLYSSVLASVLSTVQVVPAAAEDVTLTMKNGKSQIKGEMVGFDGYSYTVRSQLGEFTVEARLFDCKGEACPDLNRLDKNFVIATDYDRTSDLMFALSSVIGREDRATLDIDRNGRSAKLMFENQNNALTVDQQGSSAAAAFDKLISGKAGMALVSRLPTPEEVARAKKSGVGDLTSPAQVKSVANDAVAIAVGDMVGVRSLSYYDLVDIFSGAVDNWEDFAGRTAPITIYGTEEGDSAYELFSASVMEGEAFGRQIKLLPDSAAVLEALKQDPNGIGFLNHTVSRRSDLTKLAIEDQCGRLTPPTDFNIKMRQYPLSQVIYSILPQKADSRLAAAIHGGATSDETQGFLNAFNLLDVSLSHYQVEDQGRRMIQTVLPSEVDMTLEDAQAFFLELEFADRLSMNLTYDQATGALDEDSTANLEALATMLKRGDFDGQEIVLVGFTDSVGRPDINLATSEERASSILEQLEAMLPAEQYRRFGVTSIGFGELSPLFCNDEPVGREKNRRVEIWAREKI